MTIKQGFVSLVVAVVLFNPDYGGGEVMQSWNKYFFDGKEFREGGIALPGAAVYQREGYLPVILSGNQTVPADKLPPGTGALVIFCYVQIAGGKVQNQSGYVPFPGIALEIMSAPRTLVLRSDGEGFAIIALPAGSYEVGVQGLMRTVRLEPGKTAFMAIRAGKRMVD
jgi:hypothetical protein